MAISSPGEMLTWVAGPDQASVLPSDEDAKQRSVHPIVSIKQKRSNGSRIDLRGLFVETKPKWS